MKLLVCGGRRFGKWATLKAEIEKLHAEKPITLLIEGGAKGADRLAREWAKQAGIPVQTFEADWTTYGKGAGPIRNEQMLREGKPDFVLAFPTADSVGTWHMIGIANMAKVPTKVVQE